MIAADLRRRRSKHHTIWHLDEVYLKIDGRLAYLCRAVDAEGEVLDVKAKSLMCWSRPGGTSGLRFDVQADNKYGFVPTSWQLTLGNLADNPMARGALRSGAKPALKETGRI